MKVKLIFLISTVLLLVGCAGSKWGEGSSICDSNVFLLGKDTYMADGACGHEYELQHASIFCERRGQNILVDNIDYSTGGHVIFQCLDKGVYYQRPRYNKSPDIVVEVN